jgi:hypothetical protein
MPLSVTVYGIRESLSVTAIKQMADIIIVTGKHEACQEISPNVVGYRRPTSSLNYEHVRSDLAIPGNATAQIFKPDHMASDVRQYMVSMLRQS